MAIIEVAIAGRAGLRVTRLCVRFEAPCPSASLLLRYRQPLAIVWCRHASLRGSLLLLQGGHLLLQQPLGVGQVGAPQLLLPDAVELAVSLVERQSGARCRQQLLVLLQRARACSATRQRKAPPLTTLPCPDQSRGCHRSLVPLLPAARTFTPGGTRATPAGLRASSRARSVALEWAAAAAAWRAASVHLEQAKQADPGSAAVQEADEAITAKCAFAKQRQQ